MEPLVGEAFRNDPRVSQAKKLIQEALRDHQEKVSGVRPALATRAKPYQELIQEFGQYRGNGLWFPYLGSGMGKGALVELGDGSVKYDFICGIGPHCFGHSHPGVMEAALNAAMEDTTMQGNLQQNTVSAELSRLLVRESGLDHCFISSAGAMANENALKLFFYNKFPASRVLAFDHCFAGRTLGMSQVTDKPEYRRRLPLNLQVDYVPFFDATRPEESTQETLEALTHLLNRYPNQHAVMICELVQGEAGFYPGSREFFRAVMELLKERGVGILADEVQSFARTPRLFAFQYFGLEDYVDAVTIGKVAQFCATLYRTPLKAYSGLLSQTFTASSSALHTGKWIIETLLSQNFYGPKGKIQQMHQLYSSKMESLSRRYPDMVEGPYGVGAMMAFTAFKGEDKATNKLTHTLYEQGLITFMAGYEGLRRVRMLPPIGCLTEKDLDNALAILEKSLLMVSQEKGSLVAGGS